MATSDAAKLNLKIGAVAALLVTLAGWGWAINDKANTAAADKARMEGQLEALKATSGDHEARIRSMESGIAQMNARIGEMGADVRWMRQQMEAARK